MTKPNQGAEFNRFRYFFMGVTEAQDPVPVNPKNCREDQVSKYGHNSTRNAAPD